MPMTMEGTPESTSAVKRTTLAQLPVPLLGQEDPGADAHGKRERLAIPTMKKVPTMALPTPPPGSPTGVGRLVKKPRAGRRPRARRRATGATRAG